jgi:uncharacterized membrane protein (UPF0136 family)
MSASTVLWIYIAFLLIGGVAGYAMARSKVSLISAAVFAALLALCASDVFFKREAAYVFLGVLLVVFGMRLAKTKKFMPSGLMVAVTALALVAYAFLAGF